MADQLVTEAVMDLEAGFGRTRRGPGDWPEDAQQDWQQDWQRRLATMAHELARVSDAADHESERARLHAAEAAALRDLLRHEQAQVEALLGSTCWRLTAPARALVHLWRRCTGRPAAAFAPPSGPAVAPPAEPRARRVRAAPAAPRRFPLPGAIAAHPALQSAPPPDRSETVSVIIPTLNAGEELRWLIRKLQAQRGVGAVQIVIVDSGSTDGTPELAAALGCVVVPIEAEGFSHSAARNLGAQVACGELLLFMVQDAYPVGEHWLAGLAAALLEPHSQEERLAAVSCAEFSRTDSELVYDALAKIHYEFIGCDGRDRVGRLTGFGHAELRRQGQLSDLACMIPRALFAQYGFRGRYAEDLLLGLRLIKDGHQIAMLSSIRVVHSHCRPASYYVRRSFVDVVFLAGAFADFDSLSANLPVGTVMGSFALRAAVPALVPDPLLATVDLLDQVIARLRAARMPALGLPLPSYGDCGYAPLGAWMARLLRHAALVGRPLPAAELRAARQLQATAIARLEALRPCVAEAWPVADATATAELTAAVEKTLAMSLGAQLGFCHVQPWAVFDPAVQAMLAELKPLLLAGI